MSLAQDIRALALQAQVMADRGALALLAEHIIARLDALADRAAAMEAHAVPRAARDAAIVRDGGVVVLFDEARRGAGR